jgi:hypothetical protein
MFVPLRRRLVLCSPIEPHVRFSRVRLTDIVHRLACAVTYRTVPLRR